MSTRIRYVKNAQGTMVAMQVFQGGVMSYRPEFYPDTNIGQIVEVVSQRVVSQVQATSAHKIKIKLKEELSKLGVVFEKETRAVTKRQNSSAGNT